MSATHYLFDTKILLGFRSGEPATQAGAARKLFTRAADGDIALDTSPMIVAERAAISSRAEAFQVQASRGRNRG